MATTVLDVNTPAKVIVVKHAELAGKLTVFALLVQQHRNRELMDVMQQYMRQDIRACADTCRAVGQVTAANWLQAHADSLVLD